MEYFEIITLFENLQLKNEVEGNQRRFLSTGDEMDFGKGIISASNALPQWKQTLWDKNSTEPAMIRVPIVIISFIMLWGLNILILDKYRLQYHSVMSIRAGLIILFL